MEINSKEHTKTNNIMRHLLFFVVFIGFVSSTINKTNINSNSDREIILDIINTGYLSVIEKINDEKNWFIEKKSLEGFNKSLTFNLVSEINNNIDIKNYEKISLKEMNKILDIFIGNIEEISELNIFNNIFFNETILDLFFIYYNYENNDLNFENFNKKIIPIIYKILGKEIIEYKKDINKIKKKSFIKKYENILEILSENKNFFYNLKKYEKLNKFFKNMIDEYVNLLIIENDFIKISNFIYCFFNNLFFEFIENNYSCLKVFYDLIDCYFQHFKEILNFNNTTKSLDIEKFYEKRYKKSHILDFTNFDNIKRFLNKLLKKSSSLENIIGLDTFINIFNNIANIELNLFENKIYNIFIYTIQFYIEYIATIPKGNIEKNSKIIEIFEKNINEYIKVINFYIINSENHLYNENSYKIIYNFLYNSNIFFKDDNFNNQNLINNIVDTLKCYIKRIAIFEFIKIGFDETKIYSNIIISSFLENNNINFKNEISKIIYIQLEHFSSKISEKQELSEEFFFTIIDKYLFINVFKHEFFDINVNKNRDIVIKFLENYNYILKSANNYKDFEFFFIMSFYIINLSEKSRIYENLKINFLQNINKLTFETEIKEFIENEDLEKFKKLFIVKFLQTIKESDLKILEILEEFFEDNLKNFIFNFIENFKKLDVFYDTEIKNNPEFRKTVYNDFMKIFNYKIGEKWSEDYLDHIPTFYWGETEIRKEIYRYFEEIFYN